MTTPQAMISGQMTRRIVGLTSTTRPDAILTTKLYVKRADDLFADNDVIRLRPDPRLADLRLAGAAWLTIGEPPKHSHVHSLAYVAALVLRKLSGRQLWLLACQSSWQPNSPVVRHRKLWGSLKSHGLVIPFGREAAEGLREGSEGVRHFGALQLGLGSLKPVVAILESEPASHLVAVEGNHHAVAEGLARSGWDRPNFGPSANVVDAVCRADGIVLWPVGAFDDQEAGAVAVAKAEVIDDLLRDAH